MSRLSEIDWLSVLYTDAFIFQTTKPPRRLYHLRQLAKLFLTHSVIPSDAEAEYLCFRSLDRTDYKELFEAVISAIPASKLVVQDFRLRRSIPDICALSHLIFNLRLFPKLKNWPLKTRLYLYCRVAWYTALLKKIAKLRFKKLLVFADMQPLDNLLVQYFSDRLSITLQHGLYVDYEVFKTINTANYRNQIAEYFLAWGQDTTSLIARYHPTTKVVICGKPNLGQQVEEAMRQSAPYFSVVFDQNMFEKYNFQLLDIAYEVSKQIGLKFYLKFHPWNDPKTYSVDRSFVIANGSLPNSKFVIGHTTSLIYELLRIGTPAFKLRSREHALHTPDELQFENAQDLLALSERNFTAEDCMEYGANYISHCGADSLRKYSEFFANLQTQQAH